MIKTKSLIKQLNKSAKNLSLENKKIFDDTTIYIRTSNIKTRDAEEFLQQILDSFLNAQKHGISIESMFGTSDIKHYCEEIVDTYKASYNYLSLCGEYIMYTGMIIGILSIIQFIFQILDPFIIKKSLANSFTLNLNFDLGFIFRIVFISFTIIVVMAWVKKSCFKPLPKISKMGKIKEFLVLWLVSMLWLGVIIISTILLGKILLFKLNIIIIFIIAIALYFIGTYLSEK